MSYFSRQLFIAILCASWLGTALSQNEVMGSAKPREVIDQQDIRAQLTPRRFTTIASEIGAKIDQITVQEGGTFKAGQVLVVFDCSLQKAHLQKAQAELEAAEQTRRSNARLAELNSVGQLELDLSKSAVSRAQAELNAHQVMNNKCSITAPFAGRVAEQNAREQQFVQPGQAMLDILDDSVLELKFLVPSNWVSRIKVGGRFEVVIDETGKKYPARFTRKGARVDPVSQSIMVTGEVVGSFPELMTGMSGRVFVNLRRL